MVPGPIGSVAYIVQIIGAKQGRVDGRGDGFHGGCNIRWDSDRKKTCPLHKINLYGQDFLLRPNCP
jgi:hypothetical protein